MQASADDETQGPRARHGKISIVVPVYRSEQSLEMLVTRTVDVLTALGRPFELVLVDDCSPDHSWRELQRLKQRFGGVLRLARLLTNSGQHNAILCGFSLVTGDVIVTMDDDLQNPPEEVPRLVAAIDRGYDLAIGAYERKMHDAVSNTKGQLIDWLQRRMFSLPGDFQLTSFRAIRRTVVDSVIQMGGAFPYITSMLLANASNYVNVPVRHEARRFGRSNYNLRRGLSLASNLIVSYSAYPVLLVAILCAVTLVVSLVYGGWVLFSYFRYGATVQGWASTIATITFFNSMILLCLFTQSVYLSRVNAQLSRTRHGYRIGELSE
jgi:glycosyltransferase involved in cell wall biosynthesis